MVGNAFRRSDARGAGLEESGRRSAMRGLHRRELQNKNNLILWYGTLGNE